MKQKITFKVFPIWKMLLMLFLLVNYQGFSQCTNNGTRPDDGFQFEVWNPTCNGGSDGFIKITGITSTQASSPNANRPYSVRILTGVGGGLHPSYPSPFSIGNSSNFDLTNLPAGNYVIDIIDACGNTSADKPVTLGQPANPEFTLNQPTIIRRITSPGGTCGDTFVIKVPFQRYETGQTVSVTFTNSANQTFTPANNSYTIPRVATTPNYIGELLVEVPVAFFLNNSITAHFGSNQCNRPEQTKTIPFPPNFQVLPNSNFANVQSTANTCVSGYSIIRTLNYGTAPVDVSVVETNNPGATALDINGNPFNFVYPPNYVWTDSIQIFSGLQYGVNYTITYTDACGRVITEQLMIPAPAVAVASHTTCAGPTAYSPFVDDAGQLNVTLPSNLARSFPLKFTIISGPATWTSTLGETTVNAQLSYPQVYTYNTASSEGVFQLGTNISIGSPLSDNNITRPKQFAPGVYTIKYEDACGRTNTFTATIDGPSCIRNSTTSHVINYCGYTNGNVDLTHKITPEDRDTRSLYRINSDNSETLVMTRNHIGFIRFMNIPPGTYKVRFGGVNGTKVNYPGIGGLNGIPRIAGTDYIYEETIVIAPLTTLSFSSLASCNGSANGIAVGGQAPYTYALYNATGTTLVSGPQTSGLFTGLSVGTTYQMQAIDACGRTFNQPLTVVNNLATPSIISIAQSSCSTGNSVTIGNLPTGTWSLIDSFDGATYNGTGTSVTFTSLAVGTHTFSLINDLLCSSSASTQVVLNPVPNCTNPIIANDDLAPAPVNGTTGGNAGINIFSNDVLGTTTGINPATVILTSTPTGPLTINANGSVTVSPNTAPGTYSINYTICEVGNATNCDTATATVVVNIPCLSGSVAPNLNNAPNFLSVNNSYGIPCGATTANLSQITASNQPAPAHVILTWHSSTPATAANRVDPVTAVTGSTRKLYAAFYDTLASCYSATKEIVIYAPICAETDDYTATPVIFGVPTTLPTIFGNDTYNGSGFIMPNPNISVNEQVWYNTVIINPNGTLTVSPLLPPGTYNMLYQICDTDPDAVIASNCSVAEVIIKVISVTDLSITKTVNNATPNVGSSVIFTITATNNGPSAATGVSVAENIPAGYTVVSVTPSAGTWTSPNWAIGNMASGANATLTVVATVNAAGPYANTVTISGNETDPTPGNNTDTETPNPVKVTDLSITKTVNNATPNVGSSVIFTITATNNGPSAATGVSVAENIPAGYTVVSVTPSAGTWTSPNWAIGNMASGANATLTVVATVNAAGPYANTVTISGNETDPTPGNNIDTETPNPVKVTDLSITKTVNNATPNVGSSVIFTITATNNGPSAATGVSVAENIPAGYTVVSVTPSAGTWTSPNWAIGNMASGANATLTVVATVNAAGPYANTVTISGNETDPTPGNNTDTETPNPVKVTDLSITKTVNNATPNVGSSVIFTITATNNGPSAATGVSVAENIPAGYTVVSVTPSAGTWTSPNWAIGNMASGANATLTVVATVNAAGPYANTVTISGNETDPTPGNNTDTETPNPVKVTDLSITKTVNNATPNVGSSVIFTITATNNGPSAATGVSVAENIPAGYTVVSVTPSAGTWTSPNWAIGNMASGANATLTVVATVNAAGPYANTVTISGNETDPTPGNNTDTETPNPINVIEAVADTNATPVNGMTGGDAGIDIFGNDTLNGQPVDPSEVILTSVPAGPLTVNADGTVTVAPNTPAGTYTVDYTICEVLNPTNCDTTTVTVIVAAPVIDAVADTNATPVNGTTGGDAGIDIFGNDTLNGQPVDPSEVILTSVPAGPLTVNADGTVTVAPNTPAGTYTVDYTICEVLNPTNCDTTTLTVIVAAPVIDAVADTNATPVNGTTGGDAGIDIFGNDTLNGQPVDPSEVILTSVPAGPLTVNADGTVTVAPNTPAGTYTVDYTICEVLNPTNCDTTTVTVIVAAPAIDAVADTNATPVNGTTGGDAGIDIFGNDTLNGQPVDPSEVILTSVPAGPLTVNADGTVTVAPNTPAGTYTVDYTICEVLNPTNCDTTTVTVIVAAPVIDAVADTNATPVNGTTGGDAGIDIFGNDTLNGQPVDPSEVILTSVPAGPLTVNADGTVTVAPNTPAGTYTVDYTICEILNPTNCDTTTVTVIVAAPAIDAVADTNATPVNGTTGGDAGIDIFGNDTLNGQPVDPSEVILTSVPAGPLTVNADGTVTVAPNTPAGTYTVDYTICEVLNPTNCDTTMVTVIVAAPAIDAVADTNATPVNGTTGGDAGIDIFDNDTLNGQPVDPTEVILTSVPAGPLTVNADGTVTVSPNTPAGTYTVDYTICEVLNPTNCDTTTVTVIVSCPVDIVDTIATQSCNKELEEIDLFSLLDPTIDQTGTWTDVDNSTALSGNMFNPSLASAGVYMFTYTFMNGSCPATYEVIMTVVDDCVVLCPIQIYNAITPNDDGLNDIFTIDGILCYPNNTVTIFNRWGVEVFEAKGYDNTNKVFRGYSEGRTTISADSKLPTGTYFYILKYEFKVGETLRNTEKSGYLYINGN